MTLIAQPKSQLDVPPGTRVALWDGSFDGCLATVIGPRRSNEPDAFLPVLVKMDQSHWFLTRGPQTKAAAFDDLLVL